MPNDANKLRIALRSEPLGNIEDLVTSHIAQSEHIELDEIIEAIGRSRDPDAVANVVSALSFRRCKSKSLQDVAKSLAGGEHWDTQDRARLQAIFSLPRLCPPDDTIKRILKYARQSGNVVIRDAALVAAQTYCEIPPSEIKWGDGQADLAQQVERRVLNWLGLDVA
jgi:hypothetical protein